MHDREHPYLEKYASQIAITAIRALRSERGRRLLEPKYETYAKSAFSLRPFVSSSLTLDQSEVSVGAANELTEDENTIFQVALRAFMPWKKGPFRLFGIEIDAEWRSDLKWDRIKPHISSLAGRRVADIGCHNGYFMFRMAAENPELVVGFEPVVKHWYNFEMIQRHAALPNLAFELLGAEHLDLFPKLFDTVFCLGILYHHTDPVGLLRRIRESMAPGAELIVDCQGIPGEGPLALTPSSRYAGASGVWFLPTLSGLKNWLARSQFRHIECFYAEPLSPLEQRATSWAPIASLSDFLDPSDPSCTIEGYPAPWRFYVKARR